MPSNQADCRSWRKACTNTAPRIAERRHKQVQLRHRPPPIDTRVSPKSICSCRPGGVSKRSVARASAAKARRGTARPPAPPCAALTVTPCSRARSWRTTSALPRWRKSRSRSHPVSPASFDGAPAAGSHATRPPPGSAALTAQPSSRAIRRVPQPTSSAEASLPLPPASPPAPPAVVPTAASLPLHATHTILNGGPDFTVA